MSRPDPTDQVFAIEQRLVKARTLLAEQKTDRARGILRHARQDLYRLLLQLDDSLYTTPVLEEVCSSPLNSRPV